jgi:hypothetical protein
LGSGVATSTREISRVPSFLIVERSCSPVPVPAFRHVSSPVPQCGRAGRRMGCCIAAHRVSGTPAYL